jgi:hypothetical protein
MTDRRVIHLKRVSFAGAGASLVFADEALGLQAFEMVGKDGAVYGMAFSGMRCKPDYHYRFKSAEAASAHREKWAAGKRSSYEAKKGRAAARREGLRDAGKRLAAGDVLVASWGYEQTNYDYYQVTRVFGVRSVEIRELAQQAADDSALSMAGDCVPVKGSFIGEPMVKRVDECGRVKVRNSGVWASKKEAVLVGGVEVFKPDHYTNYA